MAAVRTTLISRLQERSFFNLKQFLQRDSFWATVCCLVLIALVTLSRPLAEIGINDDFSYIYSANVLAKTGHIVYNGWGAMPLTWQLYWGALFIKCFGFSFFILRLSNLIIALASVILTYTILRKSSLPQSAAAFGTITLLVSPVFFASTFVFMTDITGLFAILVCFFCLTVALQQESDRGRIRWLIAGALLNTALGSVRQIAWLGVLVAVPSAVWVLRRYKWRLLPLAPVWLLCAAAVKGTMYWFDHQRFTVHEPLLPKALSISMLTGVFPATLSVVFWLAPLSCVLIINALRGKRGLLAAVLSGGIAATVLLRMFLNAHPRGSSLDRWLMPFTQNTLAVNGVFSALSSLPGSVPVLLSPTLRAVLSIGTYLLVIGLAVYGSRLHQGNTVATPKPGLRLNDLFILYGPFSIAYLALYLTRSAHFDRYLLPLCFVVILLALRWLYGKGISLPALVAVPIVALAALDLLSVHDLFSFERARATSGKQLLNAGVPRTHIAGSWEFDQWTEVEATGYVKSKTLQVGPGMTAYRDIPPDSCSVITAGETPSIHPEYMLTTSLTPCVERSQFPDVHYITWLATGSNNIITGKPRTKPSQ